MGDTHLYHAFSKTLFSTEAVHVVLYLLHASHRSYPTRLTPCLTQTSRYRQLFVYSTHCLLTIGSHIWYAHFLPMFIAPVYGMAASTYMHGSSQGMLSTFSEL